MDFLPFFIFVGLGVAAAVACVVTGIFVSVNVRKRRVWRVSMIALIPTIVLVAMTGCCGYLLYYGFVLNEPMAIAACGGDVDEVRRLLDRGASPDACTVDCVTSAIACAADGGHADVVRLLLERGADPHGRGMSALEAALRKGHDDVARLLKEHEARGQ